MSQRTYRILLADDSDSVKDLVSELISQISTETIELTKVSNGLQAVNTLEQYPTTFDLIITDMEMPQLSGIYLTAIVRTLYKIPVIGISGNLFLKNYFLAAGGNIFMHKSKITEQLILRIEDLLPS